MSDNNNNNNMHIEEDAPVMRSVAMISRQPRALIQQHYSDFESSRKASLLSSPLSSGKQKVSFQQYTSTSIRHESPAVDTAAPIVWKVNSLQSVPFGYRLERTHVTIPSVSVTVDVVTTRISDTIRKESIAAVYNNDEAKVSGETKCGVRFVLRLWTSSSSSGEDCVVVECQRESGCGFTYCQTAKKILKAAKNGAGASGLKKGGGKGCPPFSIPKSIRDDCMSSPKLLRIPSEDIGASVSDSISIAQDMLLKNDRMDVKLLAMESLAQLTQSRDDACRIAAARSIVMSSSELFRTIISMIVMFQRCDSADFNVTPTEQEHHSLMHRRALTVLSNCLSALDEHNELEVGVSKIAELDSLLNSLVRIVSKAQLYPHEASDSCICLQLLCVRSMYAKRVVVSELNAKMHVEQARKQCRHVALEDASYKLMGELLS